MHANIHAEKTVPRRQIDRKDGNRQKEIDNNPSDKDIDTKYY